MNDDLRRALTQSQTVLKHAPAMPTLAAVPVVPDFTPMPPLRVGRADLASDFYQRLAQWIRDFEADLDGDTEVGARLVNFGQALTFHLTDMSYWNPALIRFDGVSEDGKPIQLIQHVSQISVLLTSVPKLGPEPRRIGFRLQREEEDQGLEPESE